jgi:tRNA C32,U32 (ribose-2'-O)-methylase TrmJ
MESVTFAVPSLGTADMARQDQIDIVVNQAAAAIVCCYLEHMNTAIEKADTFSTASAQFLSTTELTALINSVQQALRNIIT